MLFILILLIIKIFHIECDYNIYNNHFSIYFKRAFNKFNVERELDDASINHLLYNNIFSLVKIGNLLKPTLIFLSFNTSDIIINSEQYLNSITYDKESITNKTILYKDKMKFLTEDKILDLNFNLNLKLKNDTSSYIGLGIQNVKNNKNSFINQLKDNHIIENRYFSVLFKENSINGDTQNEGQILFGLLPHELTSRYNPKELYWTSITNENNNLSDLKWQIKFDSIYYHNDKESLSVKDAEFDISLNLIIGPEEFRQKILKNYFEKFINEKICKEELFYNKKDKEFYISYECKQNYDIEDFPTLNFYSKDLNETFIMKYEQLLCVFKGRYFLKVVFKKNAENKKWILGRGFMEVFPIIFDVDNKKIGYYKIIISENNPIFVFLFFTVIGCIFAFYIYKGIKEENDKNKELIKRKKDDNYNDENNKEKNNVKNTEKIQNENKIEKLKEIKNDDEKTKLLNNNKIK